MAVDLGSSRGSLGAEKEGVCVFVTGELSAGASDIGCRAPAQVENSQGQGRKSISELSEHLALRLT